MWDAVDAFEWGAWGRVRGWVGWVGFSVLEKGVYTFLDCNVESDERGWFFGCICSWGGLCKAMMHFWGSLFMSFLEWVRKHTYWL